MVACQQRTAAAAEEQAQHKSRGVSRRWRRSGRTVLRLAALRRAHHRQHFLSAACRRWRSSSCCGRCTTRQSRVCLLATCLVTWRRQRQRHGGRCPSKPSRADPTPRSTGCNQRPRSRPGLPLWRTLARTKLHSAQRPYLQQQLRSSERPRPALLSRSHHSQTRLRRLMRPMLTTRSWPLVCSASSSGRTCVALRVVPLRHTTRPPSHARLCHLPSASAWPPCPTLMSSRWWGGFDSGQRCFERVTRHKPYRRSCRLVGHVHRSNRSRLASSGLDSSRSAVAGAMDARHAHACTTCTCAARYSAYAR